MRFLGSRVTCAWGTHCVSPHPDIAVAARFGRPRILVVLRTLEATSLCTPWVARDGVEPSTSHFSGERSYQLSYLAATDLARDQPPRLKNPPRATGSPITRATPTGLEPAASAVTGRRSNQLSYSRIFTVVQYYRTNFYGRNRTRTYDHLCVRQELYQLSYTPLKRDSSLSDCFLKVKSLLLKGIAKFPLISFERFHRPLRFVANPLLLGVWEVFEG